MNRLAVCSTRRYSPTVAMFLRRNNWLPSAPFCQAMHIRMRRLDAWWKRRPPAATLVTARIVLDGETIEEVAEKT